MFVLFEEDNSFKTGTVLTQTDTALQVQTSHGKRIKLKLAHVLLHFQTPEPTEVLAAAQALSDTFETTFLWDVCTDEEFAFNQFAQDYFGHTPSTIEATAVLLHLHSAPLYFHRKGKGRFRKAPPDILQAALAGQEKKRLQQEAIERMCNTLLAGQLPPEFAGQVHAFAFRPDRNRHEVKALEAACTQSGLSVPRLLLKCNAFDSSYAYHYSRFLAEHFPEGTDFPPFDMPTLPAELPCAKVSAFSIDDATTTEIDDAFSLTPLPDGGWEIGIHIAAPGLGVTRGGALEAIARRRLSTVYMPGEKITMLPDALVQAFTLAQGRDCPALSLYATLGADFSLKSTRTCVERVPIQANLRLQDIEQAFNTAIESNDLTQAQDVPWLNELHVLWQWATILEAGRGKSGNTVNQTDFNFYVDWSIQTPDGPGAVQIVQRQRGSPLDKLVAELMIFANATWGEMINQAGIPGLYRVQTSGKVRMSTNAGPHEGLGVNAYAWSSSPLRRYADLVNQWQILSIVQNATPAFAPKSVELLAGLRDFELTYTAYADFQRQMERYWCLRWLRAQNLSESVATIIRDSLVRLENLPLVLKLPSLPMGTDSAAQIRIQIDECDLLDIDVRAHHIETLCVEPAGCNTKEVPEAG